MSEVNVSVSGSSSITPTVTNGGQVSVSVVGSSTINPTVGNGDAVNVTVASVGATGPAGAAGAAGAQGPAGTTSWSGITDKPSTFAPSSHTHAISDVTGLQTALDGKQASGTYATLVGGTVPSTQLPSYVDDVLEFAAVANFPATGEAGKIYVATGTAKIYRWSGSTYVEISPSPGSTDSVTEGSVNLYHTTARASAAAPVQSVAGRTGTVTLAVADVSGAVSSSDSRLSDSRSPTAHTHSAGDITSGTVAVARLPIVLEQVDAVGSSGATKTLALSAGSVQTVSLSANCTFTMPTATAGASLTLILTQGGSYTATFSSVVWSGGTAPTITATSSKKDILVFVSDGTYWYGSALQNF
jgi:hypothetical protein